MMLEFNGSTIARLQALMFVKGCFWLIERNEEENQYLRYQAPIVLQYSLHKVLYLDVISILLVLQSQDVPTKKKIYMLL